MPDPIPAAPPPATPAKPPPGLLLNRKQATAYLGLTAATWKTLEARSRAATPAQRRRDPTLLPASRSLGTALPYWLASELWEWARNLPRYAGSPWRPPRQNL